MNHSFNTEIAKKYGVNEAIIIENLFFWISKNKANNKNFYDGSFWTYNSAKAFQELFPYWTTRQITKILSNLKEKRVIKTGNYNKIAYDRTLWYSFTDEFIKEMEWDLSVNANDEKENSIYTKGEIESQKKENRNSKNVEPIPDINTDINTNNKPNKEFSDIHRIHELYNQNYLQLYEQGKVQSKTVVNNYGATGNRLKTLLKTLSYSQLKTVIDNAMQDDWLVEKQAYSLLTILSDNQIHKLLNARSEHKLPSTLEGKIMLDL